MHKYFLLGLLFLQCFYIAQSQNAAGLKKLLPLLKDTARVDGLNALSHLYIESEQKDSARLYATMAYKEAVKLHYIHGIAASYCRRANIAKHFDDDFLETEKLAKESVLWYGKTGNKAGIDTAWYFLTDAWFMQGRFDECIDFDRKFYLAAKQKGDLSEIFISTMWLLGDYRQSGNYDQSFLLAQEGYELALQTNNKIQIVHMFYKIAQLYQLIGDYSEALVYFRKVLQMDDDETRKQRIGLDTDIWFKMELAETFSHLNQFDSAWYYYHLYKPTEDKAVYMRIYWVSTGECYLLQKNYAPALQNFRLGLKQHKKLKDESQVMRTLLDMGKVYLATNNYAEALQYGREGLAIAMRCKAKQFMRDGYQILYTAFDHLHKADSAYYYFRKYIDMKEIVLSDQVKAKFAAYGYEQKIKQLNKEKNAEQVNLLQEIKQSGLERKLQQEQLQKQSLLKNILIAGILMLLLFGFIVFRNISLRRNNEIIRSERIRAELKQQTSELEMQALRAQMNPHFIFNCLNAINNFILQNETEAASGYLIKFSELIRKVLDHSQNKYINLGEELDTMELYIQLEQLRLNNHFTYRINCDSAIDMDVVMVPPLLFQPFVENAIWHGLMHQKENGKVGITISQDHQYLLCMIEDNGIGRQKAAEINKNRRGANSLGLKITQDRIALMSNEALRENSLTIIDLKDSDGESLGTQVAIKIPLIKEDVPEAISGKRQAKYAPKKLAWFRNLFLL